MINISTCYRYLRTLRPYLPQVDEECTGDKRVGRVTSLELFSVADYSVESLV